MKLKHRLFISIITLITTVALLATTVYAWLIFGNGASSTLLFYSGDIDLDAKVYYGNDTDKNGILEPTNPSYVAIIDPPRATRTQFLYREARQNSVTTMNECVAGTRVSYRIVVYNKSDNYTDAKISVNFSNLEDYFYSFATDYFGTVNYAAGETKGTLPSTASSIINVNTARILFSLAELKVRKYSANESGTNDFIHGFTTLTASSVPEECVGGVTLLPTLNSLTSQNTDNYSYYLWNLSARQNFVTDLIVNRGELVEIDFFLDCMQTKDVVDNYEAFSLAYGQSRCESLLDEYCTANSVTLTPTDRTAIASNYIKDMCYAELAYLLNADNFVGTKLFKFSINSINVKGTQLGAR